MNQEYVSKSACKGCDHLEHVEGALLSECEYACKAGPWSVRPAGCCLVVKKRVINMEITSCNMCPHSVQKIIDCFYPELQRHCNKLNQPVSKVFEGNRPEPDSPIPDSCPLEILDETRICK